MWKSWLAAAYGTATTCDACSSVAFAPPWLRRRCTTAGCGAKTWKWGLLLGSCSIGLRSTAGQQLSLRDAWSLRFDLRPEGRGLLLSVLQIGLYLVTVAEVVSDDGMHIS